MGVQGDHRHVSEKDCGPKKLVDQATKAIRGTGRFPEELADAMQIKALNVPLAASVKELEEVDALLVEDFEIINEALYEAREWEKLSRGNR